MPNTILTPSIIAKEAIMRLKNNVVLAGLIHKDYSKEFVKGVGETITIPVPATFIAQEYISSLVYQNITQGSVAITLSKILDVSFKVTSKELSLDIEDFGNLYVEGATDAFAQKIDELIAGLYVDIPYFVNVAGTPAVGDLIDINKKMNINMVPIDNLRRLVVDPVTQAKYIGLDAFLNADKSGSTDTLREASMGRAFTLDSYLDQNIPTHTKGTLNAAATATGTLGATTIAVTGTAQGQTIVKGDLITIADTLGQYVCTELATTPATPFTVTVKIYPALAQACTDKTVTLHVSHIANLAFHRNAFALASATQEGPIDGRNAAVLRDPSSGLAIRVVYDYDLEAKTNIVSMDMLVGVKTLKPELAVRFCG